MEFRFILVLACVCCAVPPTQSNPIGVAEVLAVMGAAKGAALLGAKALAAKGLAALAAKGAIVSGVTGAALAKIAAIKGAALIAAKGAVIERPVLKMNSLLAAQKALSALAQASAQPNADFHTEPDLQEVKTYVNPEEEPVAAEHTPAVQETLLNLTDSMKNAAESKVQMLNDIILLLSPDESKTTERLYG